MMDAYTKNLNRFKCKHPSWDILTDRQKLIYNAVMENTQHQGNALGTVYPVMSRKQWNVARHTLAAEVAAQLEMELE